MLGERDYRFRNHRHDGRVASPAVELVHDYGTPTPLAAPQPDLLVFGSVAVAPDWARTGKGGGDGEIEYALLRQRGRIDPDTPVATTVHDLRVVNALRLDPFDVTVDLIVTPTRVIEVPPARPRPNRISWDMLPDDKLQAIPLLKAPPL